LTHFLEEKIHFRFLLFLLLPVGAEAALLPLAARRSPRRDLKNGRL
jgi:hypothetical protein